MCKIKNIVTNLTTKGWVKLGITMFTLGGILYCSSGLAADQLAKMQDVLKDNIGSESILMKCLYALCVLWGSYKFTITKQPLYLVSIVPLLVFTKFTMGTLLGF